jgi:hypothetical protein
MSEIVADQWRPTPTAAIPTTPPPPIHPLLLAWAKAVIEQRSDAGAM